MDRIDDVRRAKKSPFVFLGVLAFALVVGIVVIIGFAGHTANSVRGVAMPSPGVIAAMGAKPTAGSASPGTANLSGANPLTKPDVHLSAVTCDLPELGSTELQLRGFYTATLTCLDAAWQPALGPRFTKAGLEVASEAAGECGAMPSEQEATAFYCEADESIYMPTQHVLNSMGLYRPAHLSVLAHEYAHHVQYVTGTLDSGSAFELGSPEELQESRRIELQANCFAGLFLAKAAGHGSISADEAKAAVDDFRNSDTNDTHGTVHNQIRWAEIGFTAADTASCNTRAAPAKDVA